MGSNDSVAIIPARGGSKRIPGKNLKIFCGKPILEYSVRAAQASGLFSKVIVSTDSDEIGALARSLGAEVPFRRPAEHADDFATTAAVVLHALEWLKGEGESPEYTCCLYPTAPFLGPEDLIRGRKAMLAANADGAFAVTTFAHPIFRALKLNPQGRLEMIWPEHELTRSNDLPETFHDAGQFYWLKTQAFLSHRKMWAPGAVPVRIHRSHTQDIDTIEDWEMAETMFKLKLENSQDKVETVR